ncbi:MAG: molecular chaperone DnaJ [Asticcacaulis sp.]|uniref:J domain-containing protein n=1 Tax=Asticcacaulis sp. TaxID=1872648 RepID=UPI0039E5CCFA
MLWAIGAVAVFLFLAWVGKQSRLGRLNPGPWIRQFRTLRSVIAMGLVVLGVTLLMRGMVWQGLVSFLVSFVLSGSVRYQAYFRQPQQPATAASYTPEEIKAYNTLRLAIGADRKAIREAWKRLMKAAHPDQGGDVGRASALNAARDVLLKRRR